MVLVYQIAENIGAGVKKAAHNVRASFAATDAQLLERAKKGDNRAFDELVRRYQNFIYRTALSYLDNSETARDTVQDVFIKAYRGLPYFKNDSQLTTWLYKICKNHCLNILRKKKTGIIETDNDDRFYDSELPLKTRMRRLVARLNDEYREIIMLRYYQQLKYDEIAHYLDLPLSTVKIRLFRAKQELKDLMKDYGYEV